MGSGTELIHEWLLSLLWKRIKAEWLLSRSIEGGSRGWDRLRMENLKAGLSRQPNLKGCWLFRQERFQAPNPLLSLLQEVQHRIGSIHGRRG